MTYSDKLRDPRWQKKRLEILNRDAFTCVFCESTEKELHVHHRRYERGKDPWEYPDQALVTLCKDCHERVSGLKESIGDNLHWGIDFHAFRCLHDLLNSGDGDNVCFILSCLNNNPELIKPVHDDIVYRLNLKGDRT